MNLASGDAASNCFFVNFVENAVKAKFGEEGFLDDGSPGGFATKTFVVECNG
jgi:hypothetical protein